MPARSRAQRPRLPETTPGQLAAAQAWNKGLVGQGREADDMPVVPVCDATSCGSPAKGLRPPTPGMVQVRDAGTGFAGTYWFCPGRCTVLARTRAELGAIPMRPDSQPAPRTKRRGRPPRHTQVHGGAPR